MKKLIYLTFAFLIVGSAASAQQSQSSLLFGDTLIWIPSQSKLFVNADDSADFELRTFDMDSLQNFPGGLTGTAFDEYISTNANDIDPQQGDTDTAFYWGATSFFLIPGQADNWLTFGPITIPNAGVDIRWRYKHPDANFRDAYSFYADTVGLNPADFSGPAIYSIADNAGSTGGPQAGSWRNAPLQNLDGSVWGGKKVYFAFRHTGNNQNALFLDNIRIQEAFNIGIAGLSPEDILTLKNIPNPFVDKTNLEIQSREAIAQVQIIVFDIQGKSVWNKDIGNLHIGKNYIEIDGEMWPSGTYYFQLQTEQNVWHGKLQKL